MQNDYYSIPVLQNEFYKLVYPWQVSFAIQHWMYLSVAQNTNTCTLFDGYSKHKKTDVSSLLLYLIVITISGFFLKNLGKLCK